MDFHSREDLDESKTVFVYLWVGIQAMELTLTLVMDKFRAFTLVRKLSPHGLNLFNSLASEKMSGSGA